MIDILSIPTYIIIVSALSDVVVSCIFRYADRFIRLVIAEHIDIKHMTHNFSRSTMQCGVINLLIIRSQLEQMNFETPMS